MYKVMLVDDEKQIIEGLTHIINWEKLSCEVIGSAYNGRMGVEQALVLQPDIIITDIKMPYLEGLAMIGEIQSELPLTKFIVLSGFSEFEYAKQGIQLGVKDYVLKPVEELELEASLARIVEELNAEKQQQEELMKYKELSAVGKNLIQEQYLRDLLHTKEDNEYLIAELGEFGIEFSKDNITCMIAHTELELPLSRESKLYLYEEKNATCLMLRYSSHSFAVLLNHNWTKGPNYYDQIELLKKSISQLIGCHISLCVGGDYSSLASIGKSFEEARKMSEYRLLSNENHMLFYEKFNDSAGLVQLPEDIWNRLISTVELQSEDSIGEVVQSLIQFMEESAQSGQMIETRIYCLNIYLVIASKLSFAQIQKLNHRFGKEILHIQNNANVWALDHCKQWVDALLHIVISVKKEQQHNNQNLFEDIITYIHNHYSDSLTLTNTAEHFYISPNYLSQLFRKKKSDTFLGYLTKLRIEKAKQLLLSSDMKIYEIGNQVGYEDPKYFRKLFERTVGMNPSQYKNSSTAG